MLFRAAVGVLIPANGVLMSPIDGPLAVVETVDRPAKELETVEEDPEAPVKVPAPVVTASLANLNLSSSSPIAYADLLLPPVV